MTILTTQLVEIQEHWKDGVLYSLSYNGLPVCLECGMDKKTAREGYDCSSRSSKHMWVNHRKLPEVTMQKTAV